LGSYSVGFIGLGEVATVISKELIRNGAEVRAYDTLYNTPDGRKILKERIKDINIKLASIEEVVGKSQYILSTVPTQEALKVASKTSQYLNKSKIYIEMNSTSPAIKVKIGNIIKNTGAEYVEAAILGAIGSSGPQTRVLITGPKGEKIAEIFTSLGLNWEFYGEEIGKASMFKMLRSIFSKGFECIIIELLLAGRRAGIEEDLWNEMCRFIDKHPFNKIADNWIRSHANACERRYHEMVQVNETLSKLNITPLMSKATESFFNRSFKARIMEMFDKKPESYSIVIELLDRCI